MRTKCLLNYNKLKFCPVCGEALIIHPHSGFKVCFMHGDFVVRQNVIEWQPLNTKEN